MRHGMLIGLILAAMLTSFVQAAEDRVSESMSPSPVGYAIERTFARGVYWPWEMTAGNARLAGKEMWAFVDDMLAMLHDKWNVNVVWLVNGPDDPARFCELAARHDILACCPPFEMQHACVWGMPLDADLAKSAKLVADKFRNTTGLGAYVLEDEPRSYEAQQQDVYRRFLAQADPTRPALIVSMVGDLETYMRQTGFPVLCTDAYMFGGPGCTTIPNPASASMSAYRGAVAALVEMAGRYGKTPWIMPQSYGSMPHGPWWYDEQGHIVLEPQSYMQFRMPTIAEMHWQTWEAVRAGCRGVVYFHFLAPDNPWTPERGPMPEGMAGAQAYGKAIEAPMVKQRVNTGQPASLMLPGDKPSAHGQAMGEDFTFLATQDHLLANWRIADMPVAFADAPASVQTFELPGDPATRYVVVVNDDVQTAQTLKIAFLPNVVSVRNLRDGSTPALAGLTMGNTELMSGDLMLGPGQGTILQASFQGGWPGLCLYQEDFSQTNLTVTLEHADWVLEPRPFNMGSGWSVRKSHAPLKQGKITLERLSNATATPALRTTLAGAMDQAARGQAHVYLHVEGDFPRPESLVVNFLDAEGKGGWNKANNYAMPTLVPSQTRKIEMEIRDGAAVRRVSLWRIPASPASTTQP
ncbi:MAG: hypothetical protein IT440_05675 [Phycisphaeraceae bacterium]|nr:hypothetical protein [Phycisphaeraceae bacterium]